LVRNAERNDLAREVWKLRPRIFRKPTTEPRLVTVYDSFDGGDLRSPRAFVERYDMRPGNALERITILQRRNTKFRGSPAFYVRFRKATDHSTSEVEELALYKATKGIGPSFYVVMLQTTPGLYSQDHALYLQIRDGLRFVHVPAGECSND
jgi:hypothetical protein